MERSCFEAKEQEILDLADVSLESSADFAKFAEALQEYALANKVNSIQHLEAGIRMAVQEYFNRPDSGLTRPGEKCKWNRFRN